MLIEGQHTRILIFLSSNEGQSAEIIACEVDLVSLPSLSLDSGVQYMLAIQSTAE